jgi:hypothetical protein
MHRSGTSAATRSLQVLGVDFGTNLQEGIAGVNDKGFFEDKDIVSVNGDILRALSQEWDSLNPIASGQLKGDALAASRVRAAALLRSKMQSDRVLAIKDPRMSALLPFWQGVFDELGIDAGYLIAIRNPLSVANSLQSRDRIAKEKSCYLWLEHVLPSILQTAGRRRVVVDYDRLMQRPARELARISNALGFAGKLDAQELATYEKEFLDEGLRHGTFDLQELKSDPAVPAVVVDLYQTLLRVAADELALESTEAVRSASRAVDHLAELTPALHYMSRQDQQIKELSRAVAGHAVQTADLHERLRRVLVMFFEALRPIGSPASHPPVQLASVQPLDPAQLVQTFNTLSKALAQSPDNPDLLIQLGALALAAESARDAYDYFRAAGSKSPSGLMKLHGLGSEFIAEGRIDEGQIVLEAVLRSAVPAANRSTAPAL